MRELEREPTDIDAPHPALPPIALIGRGRLGGSLAREAAANGLEVRTAGRDDVASACSGAGLALLCVPDSEIPAAARDLAGKSPDLDFAGHCSGATGLAALEPLRRSGAAIFSLHPLQTVPDAATPLSGAPAAISGSSPEGVATARRLAEALGMRPFEVREEHRAAYHAAAAIASNFLVALEESASGLLEAIGVEDARELLAPLVLRTAANWAERGGGALTGPIARGDEATVARHLEALRASAPELLPIYEALAERTRELAAGSAER